MIKRIKKGVKFHSPEKNPNLNSDELLLIQKQLKIYKQQQMLRNKGSIDYFVENNENQKHLPIQEELIKDEPINTSEYEQIIVNPYLNHQNERNNNKILNLNNASQEYLSEQKIIIKTKSFNYIDIEEINKILGIENNQDNVKNLDQIQKLKQFFLSRQYANQEINEEKIETSSHTDNLSSNFFKNTKESTSYQLQNNEELNIEMEEGLENCETDNVFDTSILKTKNTAYLTAQNDFDIEDDKSINVEDLEREGHSTSFDQKNEQSEIYLEKETKVAKDLDESWATLFMNDIKNFKATNQMKKLTNSAQNSKIKQNLRDNNTVATNLEKLNNIPQIEEQIQSFTISDVSQNLPMNIQDNIQNQEVKLYNDSKQKGRSYKQKKFKEQERENKKITEFFRKNVNKTETSKKDIIQPIKTQNLRTNVLENISDFKKFIDKEKNSNNESSKIRSVDNSPQRKIFSVRKFEKNGNIFIVDSEVKTLLNNNAEVDLNTDNKSGKSVYEKRREFKSKNLLISRDRKNQSIKIGNIEEKSQIISIGDLKNRNCLRNINQDLQEKRSNEEIKLALNEDFCVLNEENSNSNTFFNNKNDKSSIVIENILKEQQNPKKAHYKLPAKKIENIKPKDSNNSSISYQFHKILLNPLKASPDCPLNIDNLVNQELSIFGPKNLPYNKLLPQPIYNQNTPDTENLTELCIKNPISFNENLVNSTHQLPQDIMNIENLLELNPLESKNDREKNKFLNYNEGYSDPKKLDICGLISVPIENSIKSNLMTKQNTSHINYVNLTPMCIPAEQKRSVKEILINNSLLTESKPKPVYKENMESLINKPLISQMPIIEELQSHSFKSNKNTKPKYFNPFLNPVLQKKMNDSSIIYYPSRITVQDPSFTIIPNSSSKEIEVRMNKPNQGIRLNLQIEQSIVNNLFLQKNKNTLNKSVFGFIMNDNNSKG